MIIVVVQLKCPSKQGMYGFVGRSPGVKSLTVKSIRNVGIILLFLHSRSGMRKAPRHSATPQRQFTLHSLKRGVMPRCGAGNVHKPDAMECPCSSRGKLRMALTRMVEDEQSAAGSRHSYMAGVSADRDRLTETCRNGSGTRNIASIAQPELSA